MATRRKGLLTLVLSLIAAASFAALMQHSETTIPMPAPGEKTPLEKLEYRARFVASVESVTVQVKSDAGADPVVVDWIFTGSNTDGQAHRVELVVRLLDEAGKQTGLYSATKIVPPGAHDFSMSVPTKVKAEAWASARKARIFADWRS